MDRLRPSPFSGRYWVLKRLARATRLFIENHLSREAAPGPVLDYGCGSMPYRPLFEPLGHGYLGADLPFNKKADVAIAPDGRIELPDGSVGCLLSTQVLEHVTDPDAYLAEGRRVLRPGGLLFLSTHGHWLYHPDPTDYWRWTRDGLEKTIARHGFEIIETAGILNLMASGLQLLQDGIILKIQKLPLGPQLVKPVVALVFALLQRIVDWGGIRHRDASVFAVTARKRG